VEHVNEIVLVGRLSGEPEWRALSDDRQVAVWRLIVEHRDARSSQDGIDTIRCVSYDPTIQAGIRRWSHGDVIEVHGALRHRFWRGPTGPRGLYEVEAASAVLRLPAPSKDNPVRSRQRGEKHTAKAMSAKAMSAKAMSE
jgi:single-strand DNA-binding protein